ncbi:hypothetical protein CROQUDRAFT_522532 [Cronartium quercuum f. sp. fusiforme G11]|uniref:Uncharacterized protein n=1 Tax=Cronartium quercuum f. sp. fusiforme G11 TaxID=708437 RepID=A0A9P6N7L3_9BASI|nr:hypothetical protein CROQUDRAFT_522532 [Cronartium quercuum f. sp. fusiforme G11]
MPTSTLYRDILAVELHALCYLLSVSYTCIFHIREICMVFLLNFSPEACGSLFFFLILPLSQSPT